MSHRFPTALRAALVAIVASIPLCWVAIGLAVTMWHSNPGTPGRESLRAFGPAALVSQSLRAASCDWSAEAPASEAPAADPDIPSAPADLADCCVVGSSSVSLAGHGWGSDDDGFGFALVDPREEGSVSMSDGLDWKRLDWLKAQARGPFVWFRLDGDEYTTADRLVVDDVRKALAPVTQLGARQGRLGAKQGQLGARQGQLGARQGLLGARLASLQVQAGLSGDRDSRSRRDVAQIQSEMEALSRQQEPLGEEMARLGEEMGRLGAEMSRASAKAKKDVRTRLVRAVREGKAERLHADA